MVKLILLSPLAEFDELVIKPTPKTFELYDPTITPSYTQKELDGFLRTKVKNKDNHKAWSYLGCLPMEGEWIGIWGYIHGSMSNAHTATYVIQGKEMTLYGDLLFAGFTHVSHDSPLLRDICDLSIETTKKVLTQLTKVLPPPVSVVTAVPPTKATKKVTLAPSPVTPSTPTATPNNHGGGEKKKKVTIVEEEDEDETCEFSDNESDLSELNEEEILPEEEEEEEEEMEYVDEEEMEEEGLQKDETELQMEEYDYPEGIVIQGGTLEHTSLTNLQNFYSL